jgi:hypothetical protein
MPTRTKTLPVSEGVPITITPLNERVVVFTIRGTAPLVQARFAEKARSAMREKQAAGSTARKGKAREARDFDADYEGAKHVADEGWLGIPAAAFRNAMIRACSLVGFQMTTAKMSIFVEADGYDAVDGTPLVRISAGEPKRVEHMVRNATGVTDIRVRPMWTDWEAVVRVNFDADQFTAADVANLMVRAGKQVGVGEGRPSSKSSNGMGWGTFVPVGQR